MKCNKIAARKERRTYLEVQNDGPYQAEGEFRVAIDDILGPDVDQFDFLAVQKMQGRVYVMQHVKPHLTPFAWLKTKYRMKHD